MTHEKAIEIINRKSSIPNNDECFDDIEAAYNMATFALKKQIATKNKRIHRKGKWKQYSICRHRRITRIREHKNKR